MTPPAKRFRIALSFPGEQRAFVQRVAARLADHVGRERVLYDHDYEAEFARVNLDTYLQRLYRDESELVAVFLCADYERKDWCRLEWRAVRDVIKQRAGVGIMLLRFDDTEIPGLFSTDGYVWIGTREPEEIAAVIYERWRLETGAGASPSAVSRTPTPPTTAAPVAHSAVGATARALWREKLDFLLAEEAKTADAEQKFALKQRIAEARVKIRELGGD